MGEWESGDGVWRGDRRDFDGIMGTTATVVALGELLWDIFPDGARFGGAPGNFAHHAAALGADVWMVSGVGDDKLGLAALDHMRQSGLHVDHVHVSPTAPTGSVQVRLDPAGHASYHFNDRDAWDQLKWSAELAGLARRCDVACFGTLGQRSHDSRQTIQRFIEAVPPAAVCLLDLNLRPPFVDSEVMDQSLRLANVLKLNDEELAFLVERYAIEAVGERDQAIMVADRFQLRLVAVTLGERGAMLVRDGQVSEVAPRKTEVSDTVGAGDAYSAALVAGLVAGADLPAINEAACRIAEFVCTQGGATPSLPAELCRQIGKCDR